MLVHVSHWDHNGNHHHSEDGGNAGPHGECLSPSTRNMVCSVHCVLHSRPQKVLNYVLLIVLLLISHIVMVVSTKISTTSESPKLNLSFEINMNATAVPWPVQCDFSQNCDSNSVYYWMTVNVEVNGSVYNESDISAWLRNLFQNQTDCRPSLHTVTTLKPTSISAFESDTTINSEVSTSPPNTDAILESTISATTSLSHTETLVSNSVSHESEASTSIFKEVTVICANKTAIRQTTCAVFLQLTQPTNTSCIAQTVKTVKNKSSIRVHVLGDNVERVVKGICPDSAAGPPIESFEKCNTCLSPDMFCNSDGMVNMSCGNSKTVFASLTDPGRTNCTFQYQPNTCNCSSYCQSNAAYYSLDIKTADFNFNMTKILTNPRCNITNPACQALKNISHIYENSTVICNIRCIIIVKLSKAIDVCLLRSALLGVFQNHSSLVINGIVTRVAICTWENSLNADLLQPNILPVSGSVLDVCPVEKVSIVSNACKKGTNIAITLMEKCSENSITTSLPTSMVVTNIIEITPTASATNTSAATVNTTDSTASAEATAEGLLEMSRNTTFLDSIQMELIVFHLESLLSESTVSLALGNISMRIVSSLIDAPSNMLALSSNRIIGIVDTVGRKLAVQGQSQSFISPSVALAVKLVDWAVFQETTFSFTDLLNFQIGPGLRRIETSAPQGSIILPASLKASLTPQQQQLASRLQFNFYQKTTLFMDKTINPNNTRLISGVLGASVANLSISNLKDQIIFTLKNTETIEGNHSRSCVFWRFDLNGGFGGWSSQGCSVLNHTETETICGCNHLTNFGVLLDISREQITSRLQATILTYITYIGCGISAIFLSITLMTYLGFEMLRKDTPSKIVIHLCLSLLLLNLTFLLDAWLALYPDVVGLCISTAFFLHYFLLASFTWMAMEAVHMYLALVKVFNTYVSHFMLKLGLAGWGIPLIVVITVIAIDKNNYGLVSYGKFEDGTSDQFCWMKNEIAYYVAVVAYFCVVFILNLSMFIVVLIQICRIKRQNPHNLQHRSILNDLRSVVGLTVLLGLTWGFAFFAWDAVNLPFMYLFAIFNSLQGFFIFVFHCAVKENVRRQWRMHLCCGNLRRTENSAWSHTTTEISKKSSVNRTASSSRAQKSSNCKKLSISFLASDISGSDGSMGVGSPLDDDMITEQE